MATPLRVLQVYNEYRRRGGEDTVADLEASLLRRHGHEVDRLTASTTVLNQAGRLRLMAAGLGAVWSSRGYSEMQKALSRFSPDIVHVHNTFPLLSPSVYWAAHRAGVPVVQTLHNFRLTCANAHLFRDGKHCQDCVGRLPWPALRHRCFHHSFLQTAAVASTNVVHRWLGTYETKVDAYIALTEFSKEIMVRAGLPPEKIFVKPNFGPNRPGTASLRLSQVVFVGAISRGKGAHLLLEAWASGVAAGHQLLMIGDGPDVAELERRYAADSSIVWCGRQPHDRVLEALAASRLLVLPSLFYENFPVVVLEAWSVGTPVVVPDHGAFPSLVSHLEDGLLFSSGDAVALAQVLRTALSSSEHEWPRWSINARKKYITDYTELRNYQQLISIYQKAIHRSSHHLRTQTHRSPVVSSALGAQAQDLES